MRIPFDSLCLAAITYELQAFVGGKVQRISQPNEYDIVIDLYARGLGMLLISVHPEYARVHFVTKRAENPAQPPQFCTALRSRIGISRLISAEQRGFDRILDMRFEGPEGEFMLVAELMGKHSNAMLLDSTDSVVAAAKWVKPSMSKRPIQAGMKYKPPPFDPKPSLLSANPNDDLKGREGASPFLLQWIAAQGRLGLNEVQKMVAEGSFGAFLVPGVGAYPLNLTPLGLTGQPKSTLSLALEVHFSEAIIRGQVLASKASLRSQVERVKLARETALHDLQQAIAAGRGAGKDQLKGELILAYGPAMPPGQSVLKAQDYEGQEMVIKLNPELDFKQNANRYFDKAKRAKARLGYVEDQRERLSLDLADIDALLVRLEVAERMVEVEELLAEAKSRKWLNKPPEPKAAKEERPYEGHRIRELIGPGGYTVLYGENAESNDYLTLRVAKPNDWWLHVRGSNSSHVIVQTKNQPDKVQRETLMYAAKVAVQNSPSKHAGYVPVDYTLKKYVRKAKGAPKGSALYTHEKTLHVES